MTIYNKYLEEAYDVHQHQHQQAEQQRPTHFRKKAGPQTLQQRRLNASYESRRNTCNVCYTQLSRTGECFCQ